MSLIDKNEYKRLKNNFLTVAKRVLKENLSTNPAKLKEYEIDLVSTYNEILTYVGIYFDNLTTERSYYREELIYIRDKIQKCFGRLNSKTKVSTDLLKKN